MHETTETRKFFTDGPHYLCYRVMGHGPQTLLAFHGYGQDHRVFREMAQPLGDRYTLYCFDLFYHGQSSWPSLDGPITTAEWSRLIERFLAAQEITRFSLMGYSMGGRFALSLVEALAERIDRVILLAPDGIRSSRWYQLSSTTRLGNYLLRRTIVRPGFLFCLIRLSRQSGIGRKNVLRFVEEQMRTRRQRYQVYCRWTGLRRIQPHRRRVIRACNRWAIPVETYLGQYDRIVKAKAVAKFHKKLANNQLHFLPCGHNALIRAVAEHFLSEQ